ncbi:putative DNA-directed RNA polymerase subunit 1 inactive-like protein [Powai lake megavirus]|uniref:Putative DNA-directed RNA polymerase subunit 1 inactive-like protein n=1 Tax=Powai lake megavirus TaxID=1842663 RepID=A0A167R1Q8_9VIRU|nr:putative DNA-directed RNA polymerase subunit 1 inactive-like protein [Powai lake megavirus]ANB50208.1 putative DNA-directed RNA polymerase subunit 1 inactive-like protein [Powai lake megavirus]
MKTIIDYLNHDVFLLIFDLLPDRDKIGLAMTNKYMAQYINHIIYTDLHQYERVRFLPFRNHFRRLSFRPRYDIIPPIITDLIIDKKFIGSLRNVIPNSVKNLKIDHNIYDKNKNYIRKYIKIFLQIGDTYKKKIHIKEDDVTLYKYSCIATINSTMHNPYVNMPYIGIYKGYNTEDGLLINNNNLRMGQYCASERYIAKNRRTRRNLMGKIPNIKSLLEYLNSKCVPVEKNIME